MAKVGIKPFSKSLLIPIYPSLEAVEVANIVFRAVHESQVEFKGVDYMEACKYIALTSTEQQCRIGPLRRILPQRRHTNGTRPGITGEDPLGPESGGQDQWKFPHLRYPLTSKEKKTIVAKTLHTAVLAIFKTHTYSFANRFFLQRVGGLIGLRSTCCIARIVMLWWDERLLEVITKSNIKLIEGARYMDDIRIWLHTIRLGWRWSEGGLKYRGAWKRALAYQQQPRQLRYWKE